MKRRWIKIERGHYRLEGTPYEVQSDGMGYVSQRDRDGDGLSAGVTGGEWAVIDTRTDENVDWFATMREARAEAETYIR